MAWKHVTSPHGNASSQSYGHCILRFRRNCTDWLSWT